MRRRRGLRSKQHKTSGPHVYRRGQVWYAYFARHNEPSLGTRDESEARERFAALIASGATARADSRPGEKALDVIAESYLRAPHGWTGRTLQTTRNRALAFVQEMEARRVVFPSQITNDAHAAWRTERMKVTSRATINRDEDVARSMLAWAQEQKLCGPTPLAKTKHVREARRKPPPIIPSPKELATSAGRMLALGENGAAMTVALALATGLRIDELRHLAAHWIERDAISVVPESGAAADAWQSKGFAQRRIPVAEQVTTLARQFYAWRSKASGGKGKPIGMADSWIAKIIDRANAADESRGWPELPRYRMHDVRRTFATECVRGGTPITTVRDWLGHVDVQTTELYLGKYRDDAAASAPTPAALAIFGEELASVIALPTAVKVTSSAAVTSGRQRRATAKSQGEKRHGKV